MRKVSSRSLTIGLFVAIISFGNYTRLTGTECIRAIHMVTLITCGMGLGVALVSAIILIRGKQNRG